MPRGIAAVPSLLVVLCLGAAGTVGARTGPTRSDASATKASPAAGTRPDALETALFDPFQFGGPSAKLGFARARQTGATAVRLLVPWSEVAPGPPSAPADPADVAYHWAGLDRQVRLALQAGLEPILCVVTPPRWARTPAADGSTTLPQLRNPSDLGKFMLAAATRYGGSFRGLPRVRYWQAWNEPNINDYLSPQYQDGEPASPAAYRRLVNSFADAVHRVHADNVVIAGGLSPFTQGDATTDPAQSHVVIAPMRFMRELLCMSDGARPKPTCKSRVTFDVWTHHPYTSGGPTHHAYSPDDVSLGDLPEMKALLDAAVKAGHVRSRSGLRFWVDEFSWDSNPPDPKGVPAALEATWVSEAMYRMWTAGISLVTWFLVQDAGHFQSSLYLGDTLADAKPKPALAAFRFPFVGHVEQGRISIWGRTPWGRPGRILVEEERQAGGWRRLGVVQTNPQGIFTAVFGPPRGEYVRARVLGPGGLAAPAFPLAGPRPPDLPGLRPFGGG